MLSLGIDIGTTSICGVLLDAETGKVTRAVTRENNSFMKTSQEFARIQDPAMIMETVDALLAELFCDTVGVIGFTGQMHGIVYLDKDGNAVSPLYTWQDGRGNLRGKDGKTYAERLHGATGFGLVTDLYNEENGLIPQNAVTFCTIHDYAAMKCSGRKTPLVHSSDAASFGCYDVPSKRFTVKNPRLPDITDEFCVLGEFRNVPVVCAIGDNQASFLASAGADTLLVNVGTGSQVSIPTDGYQTAPGLETRPLNGDKCILVGSSLCGGRAFAILERFFADVCEMATGTRPDTLYPAIDKMLSADADTTLKMDTRFSGTRAEPSLRGSISGISTDNFTAKDVAIAALDGITDELYQMYAATGIRCSLFVGSGNGIRRNPALKRTMEHRFGMPIQIPENREEAAAGAALSALAAIGVYDGIDGIAAHVRYEK